MTLGEGEPEGATPPAPIHRAGLVNPDDLLDARKDPGAQALGSVGLEGSSSVPYWVMLRRSMGERAAKSPRYQWWVLCALLSGLLALNFTFTVFNIALVPISKEFRTSTSVLTWTLTGPLLAFGLAAPIFGRASDVLGHRRLYLFGLCGAMVSAVLTALSVNTAMLLAARALDGIQGAATATASMALINSVFSKSDRVKALGWWSLVGAGGPVLGVAVGALVFPLLGWRALFWIQLVLLLVATVVVSALIPKAVDAPRGVAEGAEPGTSPVKVSWEGMDWVGSWSLSIGVFCFMLAVTLLTGHRWNSQIVLGLSAASVVAMAVFVRQILRSPSPLIPKHYFGQRNFVFPLIARATTAFAYFGAFFLFPLLLEQGYGMGVGKVGIISIARPFVFAIASPISGYVAIKIGERTTAVAGCAFLAASLFVFWSCGVETGLVVVVVALVLNGIGMGSAGPATASTMANEVEEHEYGVMSAAQLLAMQVGEVAGIQILVAIQAARVKALGHHPTKAELLSTFHLPFLVGGVVGLVAVVASVFMRSLPREQRGRKAPADASH